MGVTPSDDALEDAAAPEGPAAPVDANDDAEANQELGWLDRVFDRVDDIQRHQRVLAFVVALLKRFGDDRGSQYAALLAYYGFFSLLPMLLVLTTILARVLADDPALQEKIITTVTDHVPVTGTTVADNVRSLDSSGAALVIGLVAIAYGALGFMNTAQDAFNTMWGVPRFRWPNLAVRAVRSLGVVLIVGSALALASVSGSVITALDLPAGARALGLVASYVFNTVALLLCFRLLISERIAFRTLAPGAIAGGIGLLLLQVIGAWYLRLVVARADALYGVFAAAIGLLVWIGLQARVLLLAGEINVVRARHLYPRSLTGRRLGPADRDALADAVAREALAEGLVVHARVRRDAMHIEHDDPPPEPGPEAKSEAKSGTGSGT